MTNEDGGDGGDGDGGGGRCRLEERDMIVIVGNGGSRGGGRQASLHPTYGDFKSRQSSQPRAALLCLPPPSLSSPLRLSGGVGARALGGGSARDGSWIRKSSLSRRRSFVGSRRIKFQMREGSSGLRRLPRSSIARNCLRISSSRWIPGGGRQRATGNGRSRVM